MEYIAVLLTVHNRRDKTIACLGNLYIQKLPENVQVDVYMVDDGCTDGTAQAVKEQFPSVNIIQGDGALYWNRGMWTAWDVASKARDYDYYLWLNDDTDLLSNAINSLLVLSTSKDNKAIIVGATQNGYGDRLTYGGRKGKRIPLCDGTPHEVEWFNGNIVLVPQIVFDKLGNLNYYYRHSKGDYDYGIRAHKAGIKMFQCGNVLGVCEAHEKLDGWCDPDVPFNKRWHLMHLPNGMSPKETFHLEKQTNIVMASVHYFTIYIRCVFPGLWLMRNRCGIK